MIDLQSANLVEFLRLREGIEDGNPNAPGLQPYVDVFGYWTIGYGRLIFDGDRRLQGPKDKARAYELYPAVSLDEAIDMLYQDLPHYTKPVADAVRDVPTTQNQFDALASFCFNVGQHNFETSTLLTLHLAGKRTPELKNKTEAKARAPHKDIPLNAPDQFMRWVWGRNDKGQRVCSNGLINRRWLERQMYLTV